MAKDKVAPGDEPRKLAVHERVAVLEELVKHLQSQVAGIEKKIK